MQAYTPQSHAGDDRAASALPHMIAAAEAAAALIAARSNHRTGLEWRTKAHADFVSDVDTDSERLIRDMLLQRVPGASVIGEEFSPEMAPGAGAVFIVDPLDGTTNFLHGYPEYAVSIGLVLDGVLSAGVVHNAAVGGRFTALLGRGAQRDGTPISVSPITDPAKALIGTGFPFRSFGRVETYLRQFEAVSRGTSGLRRAGSAALDLCDVACGRFDGFWELELQPWDFAAGVLIVREAGGVVTTTAGGDVPFAPSSILAGSPATHEWLLETLRSAAPEP
ncbi:MAG TPA: inositol monophosphatase family protein [Gemmatimonadaceae bacterium]